MNQKNSIVTIKYSKDFDKLSKKALSEEIIKKAFQNRLQIIKEYGLNYPSLQAKKFKEQDIWQFYITKKYRCFFDYNEKKSLITIRKVTNHP